MPKIVDKEAKRRKIQEAALHVFANKGLAEAKVAEIAKEAGIGKGTIYEYYRSKEEIFDSVIQFFMESIETSVAKRIFKVQDPRDKLKQFALGTIEGCEPFPPEIMLDFWTSIYRSGKTPKVQEILKHYRYVVQQYFEEGVQAGIFREDLDTTAMATIIIGLLDGLGLQAIVDKENFAFADIADKAMDAFLRGIEKDQ